MRTDLAGRLQQAQGSRSCGSSRHAHTLTWPRRVTEPQQLLGKHLQRRC